MKGLKFKKSYTTYIVIAVVAVVAVAGVYWFLKMRKKKAPMPIMLPSPNPTNPKSFPPSLGNTNFGAGNYGNGPPIIPMPTGPTSHPPVIPAAAFARLSV